MESICVDITINKRKWGILFAYRAPNKIIYLYIYIIYILYIYYIYIYIYIYIEGTTLSAYQLLSKFDSIFIAHDFNVDNNSKECNK